MSSDRASDIEKDHDAQDGHKDVIITSVQDVDAAAVATAAVAGKEIDPAVAGRILRKIGAQRFFSGLREATADTLGACCGDSSLELRQT